MKTAIITAFMACAQVVCHAQTGKPFAGTFENKEYDIYLKLNLYDKNITVPQQEIFGETDGYLGDYKDSRKWIITGSSVDKTDNATLSIINDYGSEDLTATLKQTSDSTLQLTQGDGSNIKIARNRKWVKLPGKIVFTKKK